jgi:hypothetical protein
MYAQELSFRNKLAKNYINAIGWRSKRKLLLIESDDWGAIRMPSKSVYETLRLHGAGEGYFFDKYDSLESSEDLALLFEVLSSVKDSQGHHAIMEPFAVVANPNYEAIEANGFNKYVYEPFVETYRRFSHTEKSFETIKEGMLSGIWYPQSHGREHIQINRWIKALQSNDKLVRLEFSSRAFHWGCLPPNLDYYNAFDYDSEDELPQLKEIIREGLQIFEKLYGYKSLALCAPCGYACQELIDFSSQEGIRLRGGQYYSPDGNGSYKVTNKYWGAKGVNDMRVYRRNCKFEPSRNHNIDWVDRCLSEIKIAFRWGKPAVIDSHRVNYIGSIDEENRGYTLKELKRLLDEIVKLWPDVEFVNSEQLYEEMTK